MSASRVVLDTNVVLDWLVFADPAVVSLAAALEAGRLHWLVTPRMREEYVRAAAGLCADSERTLLRFDRYSDPCEAPPSLPALRCRDPDDQPFIDLAVARQARWLVTRDKALLALRRRAAVLGVSVLAPRELATLPQLL